MKIRIVSAGLCLLLLISGCSAAAELKENSRTSEFQLNVRYDLDIPFDISRAKFLVSEPNESHQSESVLFETEYQKADRTNFIKGDTFSVTVKNIVPSDRQLKICTELYEPDSGKKIKLLYTVSFISYTEGIQTYDLVIDSSCDLWISSDDKILDAQLMSNERNVVIVMKFITSSDILSYTFSYRGPDVLATHGCEIFGSNETDVFMLSRAENNLNSRKGTELEIDITMKADGSAKALIPKFTKVFENGRIYCFQITENNDRTFTLKEL